MEQNNDVVDGCQGVAKVILFDYFCELLTQPHGNLFLGFDEPVTDS